MDGIVKEKDLEYCQLDKTDVNHNTITILFCKYCLNTCVISATRGSSIHNPSQKLSLLPAV